MKFWSYIFDFKGKTEQSAKKFKLNPRILMYLYMCMELKILKRERRILGYVREILGLQI